MKTSNLKGELLGWLARAAAALTLLGAVSGAQAAKIIIVNLNAAGVGFNDTTPAAPVGGNTGTTVGQQRLIAFSYAANKWGAQLTSNVPILINAQFSALSCTATGATLGSAGATSVFRNFRNAPKADTWYSYALANKLANSYLGTSKAAQINANFNANLGSATGGNTNGVPTVPAAGCLTGTTWYYGLDSNEASNQIDFVAVLMHEMGHGVGFQTFTSGSSGAYLAGFPSIWDHFLFGTVTGKTWTQMTAAERAASALTVTGLVWNGPLVTAAVPSVLRQGLPKVQISGANAGSAAGTYSAGEASFGPPLSTSAITADVMPVSEQTAGAGEGCEAFNAANAAAVLNNIALIRRGVCGFVIKVKNAQLAGARAVIITDNVTASLSGLGGSDATITIPAVRVTLADGNTIRSALTNLTANSSGVLASVGLLGTQYAGADPLNRALMYAPTPFISGSSVSHYDVSATPNLLMEPNINGDLGQSLIPPFDLTFTLLQDIGW
jgi:hypothetical protein